VISSGKIKIRQNEAIQIEKDGYKIVFKSNWLGEKNTALGFSYYIISKKTKLGPTLGSNLLEA